MEETILLTDTDLKKKYIEAFLANMPPATGNPIHDLMRESMLQFVEGIRNMEDNVFSEGLKNFRDSERHAMHLALNLN